MDAQSLQPAYVLHTRRYGDSSLIADLFVREQGRVACIAKGVLRARRADTRIQPFQPLLVDVRGRSEVLTLARAEPAGAALQLLGRGLYCGLYLNELLLKLTPRQDAYPALFDDYALAIQAMQAGGQLEPVLRHFEVRLLEHLGLGLVLEHDYRGQPVVAERRYIYDVGAGPQQCIGDEPTAIHGRTLLALRSGELADRASLREARELMRRVLHHHLDGRPLRSRELFR
ncbi:MAG: DNA repair protein RecO [Chromatiaceae bacterium]|nr:DNA repair protein RecO [Chromatiaceae bacterium]